MSQQDKQYSEPAGGQRLVGTSTFSNRYGNMGEVVIVCLFICLVSNFPILVLAAFHLAQFKHFTSLLKNKFFFLINIFWMPTHLPSWLKWEQLFKRMKSVFSSLLKFLAAVSIVFFLAISFNFGRRYYNQQQQTVTTSPSKCQPRASKSDLYMVKASVIIVVANNCCGRLVVESISRKDSTVHGEALISRRKNWFRKRLTWSLSIRQSRQKNINLR